MEYLVTWSIQIDASSPEEAAREAMAIQQDPESAAHVFHVFENVYSEAEIIETRVDLDAHK